MIHRCEVSRSRDCISEFKTTFCACGSVFIGRKQKLRGTKLKMRERGCSLTPRNSNVISYCNTWSPKRSHLVAQTMYQSIREVVICFQHPAANTAIHCPNSTSIHTIMSSLREAHLMSCSRPTLRVIHAL